MRGSKSVVLLLLLHLRRVFAVGSENYLVPYEEVAETYVEYPDTPIVQSLLEAEQEIPAVSMSIWSTPIDFRYPLFYIVKGIVRRLDKELLEFQPNYLLADGHERGCSTIDPTTGAESGNTNDTDCVENCSNYGRYCAAKLPQDPLLKTKINGFAIVEESLRRHCIWNVYGRTGGNNGLHFWRYVNDLLFEQCEEPFSQECTYPIMEHIGINTHFVERCMNHTHGVEEDSDDAYLEEMIEAGREIPPDDLPQLQINGAFFEGELSTKAIFRAVCASYPDEKQPSVCGYCGECSDVRFCLWFLECKDSDSTTFEQFVATSRTTETTDNNSLPNIAQNTATNSPLSTSENKSNNNDQAIIFAMKGVVIGLACSALITVFFVHRDYKARKELKEFAKAEDLEQQEHRYECDTADIRHERNNANMSTKDLEGVSNEFLAQELPDIS